MRLLFTLTAVLCAALFSSSDATAFVRTQTCDPNAEDIRRLCRNNYVPVSIWWPTRCVTIFLNRQGSDDFPSDGWTPSFELREALGAAMAPWNDVSCSDITLTYGGLTCNRQVVKRQDDVRNGFMNTVMWQDEEWDNSASVLALARVHFDAKDGRIYDVDVELNGVDNTFGVLQTPGGAQHDVENTLVHEFGHLLGLAHELDQQEATMYPEADTGELTKRDLHPDDEAGVCAAYPTDTSTPACFPSILEDNTCIDDYSGQTGCTQTPGPTSPPSPWWVLLGVAGWAARRRARFPRPTQRGEDPDNLHIDG